MTPRGAGPAGRLAAWGLPPALVVLIVWLSFGGTSWDSRIPASFAGDALFYLAQSKATIDHGWWWENPSIAAPFGYHALVFAQNTNVDQAIVWIVGLFTNEIGQAVNLAWMAMLALGAVTATWGLRRIGVSALGAGAGAVLFALCPFAFDRHIAHLNVVMYLVPFPATAALLLASASRDHVWRWRDLAVPVVGCMLLGFNYIYNAFFGAALVSAGVLIGFGRTRSIALVKAGAACLGAIVLATALNLVPNRIAWDRHGHPVGVEHLPLESEEFGLKVRHMVRPVGPHWFPPFQAWLERDAAARFQHENENQSARLGVVASLGWLALMAALILPGSRESHRDEDAVPAAARLSASAVLLATVGGFGSLFSFLATPDIRAWNRISPFITYFAIAAVAVWIDRLTRTRSPRARAGAWLTLLAFGIADQHPALTGLTAARNWTSGVWQTVQTTVSSLEAKLPEGAAVFQLPLTTFPVDPGVEGMRGYDHFRPYLVSRHLRWSFPVLTIEQRRWQRDLMRLPESEWTTFLSRAGFRAILINRAGYADGGQAIALALRAGPQGAAPLAEDAAFIALDLRASGGGMPAVAPSR